MVYIINKKKYDTDKMELISDKCKYGYKVQHPILGELDRIANNVKIYKSKKNNWLMVFDGYARTMIDKEAQNILLGYDYKAYEKLFGELEEA